MQITLNRQMLLKVSFKHFPNHPRVVGEPGDEEPAYLPELEARNVNDVAYYSRESMNDVRSY